MKCPHCQAELLPVDGEMFCLQCGRTTQLKAGEDGHGPPLENTADPVLQKAIQEIAGHPVKFRLPVSDAAATPVKSFGSAHKVMAAAAAAPAAAMAAVAAPAVAAAGGGAAAMGGAGVMPAADHHEPSPPNTEVQAKPAPEPKKPVQSAAPPKPAPTEPVPDPKFGPGKLNLLPDKAAKAHNWRWPAIEMGVLARPGVAVGVASVALFVALNIGVGALYSGKVYPGVHVGQSDVSGLSDRQLQSRLGNELKPLNLSATVGGSVYALPNPNLGAVDLPGTAKRAEMVGHSQWLPLVGLLAARFSAPVPVSYNGTSAAVDQVVNGLAAQVDHDATAAVPVVVNGQAFVITDKTGDKLDRTKAAADVRQALAGGGSQFSAPVSDVTAVPRTGAFKDDVAAAQARLSLTLKLVVGKQTFSPSAAQIGSWLVFRGPGKGVAADSAPAAAYVGGIPGQFDRAGAVSALVGAINSGQNLNFTPAAGKVTPTPVPAGSAPAWPLARLNYCLNTAGAADAATVAGTLEATGGWALGGRLAWKEVVSGCNFTLALVPVAAMGNLDPACAKQTTCNVGNQIEISAASWNAAPAAWTGSLSSYRSELINHEVGHWMGFNHADCVAKATVSPKLQVPTLVLVGCSPDWYEIDPGVQGTKVLPGF